MQLKKTLTDIAIDGKSVLVRLDLNVPIQHGIITDDNRVVQTLPTINYLLEKGCKVIVLSHFSRIKSLEDIKSNKKTLRPVAACIQKHLPGYKVDFIPEIDFTVVEEAVKASKADVIVLENTRYYDVNSLNECVKWESKNFSELSSFWSRLADVFVNDAFGTSHRSHASNVGLATVASESCVGFLVDREISFLSKAIETTESPKVMILGGSKVSDKLKLIKNVVDKVDTIIVGGAMSYTFLKSMGKDIGSSIVEQEMVSECADLLKQYGSKIALPIDHAACSTFADQPSTTLDADCTSWNGQMALDIGPKTVEKFSKILDAAKVVIWNGPMGVFEFFNFENGTKELALKLAELTDKGVYTVIGGGDTAAAIAKFNLSDKMSFISTGGGASISFFEGSDMPGLIAIQDK